MRPSTPAPPPAHNPATSPRTAMSGASPEEAIGSADPVILGMEAMVTTLRATGSSWTETLEAVALNLGTITPHRHKQPSHKTPQFDTHCVAMLESIAKVHPGVANTILIDGLASGNIREWDAGGVGLHLAGQSWLTSLPAELKVRGDLTLGHCTSLEALPEGLDVGGGLYLWGCTSLKRCPDNLHVGRYLDFMGCTSLERLPQGLQVDGHLRLNGCPSLSSLPADMTVRGAMYAKDCVALRHLPAGLNATLLDLAGCRSLESLPTGLKVHGYLMLTGCQSLAKLPDGLEVGEALYLYDCTAWDGRIPEGAKIQGRIFTDLHPDGIHLAAWRELHPGGERT